MTAHYQSFFQFLAQMRKHPGVRVACFTVTTHKPFALYWKRARPLAAGSPKSFALIIYRHWRLLPEY